MQKCSPIHQFRKQLREAKTIAEDMLIQPVEPPVVVAYMKEIIEGWDRLDRLERLSGKIEEELAQIEEKLTISGHFELGGTDTEEKFPLAAGLGKQTYGTRPLRIEVSEGMIRQNLLTLTNGVKRGMMKAKEEIRIQLPNGELLTSKIMPPGNRLQERGRIRRLYQECNIKPGDIILLEKIESGEWKMQIEPKRTTSDDGLSL